MKEFFYSKQCLQNYSIVIDYFTTNTSSTESSTKENEVDFANQSYTQLGNRCGNGWDVNLVGKIFHKIFKQARV